MSEVEEVDLATDHKRTDHEASLKAALMKVKELEVAGWVLDDQQVMNRSDVPVYTWFMHKPKK